MEKRVVEISFDLWRDMLTQGWKADHIECTKGLPEGAKLVGTYRTDHVCDVNGVFVQVPSLMGVFEAEEWSEKGPLVQLPSGEQIHSFTPEFQQKNEQYSYILTVNGRHVEAISSEEVKFSSDEPPEGIVIEKKWSQFGLEFLPMAFEIEPWELT